jgi:hypothetical protein
MKIYLNNNEVVKEKISEVVLIIKEKKSIGN